MGHHWENPHFDWYIPLSKACSNKVWLWSRPKKSIEGDALRARGTKQRYILAVPDRLCFFISASVELSPSSKLTNGTSVGPDKQQRWKLAQILPNVKVTLTHSLLIIHGSIYCGAKRFVAWRGAPNLDFSRGTIRSTTITNFWMNSRLTRSIKL